MRAKALCGLAVVALVGLVWAYAPTSGEARAAAAVGSPAPAFSLEDQGGRKVSLSDHAGKIVVLEWINPDCPFVQRHYKAGTMSTLAGKYAGKDVVWLAVNSSNYAKKADNDKWVSANNLTYPILDDHAGEVGRLYGAKTTPHVFIIDKSGTLVYEGGIDDDPRGDKGAGAVNFVDKALGELTAGKAVSTPQTRPYGCNVKYK